MQVRAVIKQKLLFNLTRLWIGRRVSNDHDMIGLAQCALSPRTC